MKTDIAKALLKLKAVDLNTREGFTYTSGKKGPIYCDNRIMLSYPAERSLIADSFVKLIEEKKLGCDCIAGVATGAIAWGALVAHKLNKPFVYVRPKAKEHGKQNQIEGKLEKGAKVIVIEDLVNSGGSSVSACEAIKETSRVVACVAIFNYGFETASALFVKAHVPLYSLTDLNTLIAAARETNYITDKDRLVLLEWNKTGEWK